MGRKKKYKISLIGAGRVASALAAVLYEKGFLIHEVWSLHKKNAGQLAKKVKAKAIKKIEDLNPDTDLFIIAIKDDEIKNVVTKIPGKNPVIAHTSGTISIKELQSRTKKAGVFYPLQTFAKNEKMDFKTIPLLVEATEKTTEKMLLSIAKTISNNVLQIKSGQRKKIHLAAVFAANFPNFLYVIAEELLKKEKINFTVLLPLIDQVNKNLKTSLPSENQTGPAFRKDEKVIKDHILLLQKNRDWQLIYKVFSESIMDYPFRKTKKKPA